MSTVAYFNFDTPIGKMWIASTNAGVCLLTLPNASPEEFFAWIDRFLPDATLLESSNLNDQPMREVLAYLDGQLRVFDSLLDMQYGTDFQRSVWRAVADIPYGETRSYAEIARVVGRPRACRAVGAANGANPLPIFVPCHRVVGSNGTLVGYGGGLDMKEQLLDMERNVITR